MPSLLDHCSTLRCPLVPTEGAGQSMAPEDWWFDRFGEDPLWGRKQEK